MNKHKPHYIRSHRCDVRKAVAKNEMGGAGGGGGRMGGGKFDMKCVKTWKLVQQQTEPISYHMISYHNVFHQSK